MLAKLLNLMTLEGVHHTQELARRLETSPELVQQAIELLVQRGYLRGVEGCASAKCAGCGAQQACNPSKTRLWLRVK